MARIFVFLLLFFSTGAFASTSITSVRVGVQPGGVTRIVLDSTKNIDFKMFTLLNPHRLVIDVKDAHILMKENENIPVKGVVSKVRWGHNNGISRFAIELNDAIEIKKHFALEPASGFPWRLVIDIAGKGTDKTITSVSGGKSTIISKPKPIIVIDPGHGGRDPGAIGVSGVYEKRLTLAAGLSLKKALEKTGRYKVVMTRSTDKALALRQRVDIARKNNGTLFISIHADSAPNKKARGLSVYTISEKSSDIEAKRLAERENKADIIAGVDFTDQAPEVADILIDLTKRETDNLSSRFAEYLVADMSKNIRVIKDPHRFAGFAVLKAPDIPSVLLEMGYLSNSEEEKLIKQSWYREKIVESLVRSINRYFAYLNKNDNL